MPVAASSDVGMKRSFVWLRTTTSSGMLPEKTNRLQTIVLRANRCPMPAARGRSPHVPGPRDPPGPLRQKAPSRPLLQRRSQGPLRGPLGLRMLPIVPPARRAALLTLATVPIVPPIAPAVHRVVQPIHARMVRDRVGTDPRIARRHLPSRLPVPLRSPCRRRRLPRRASSNCRTT